MKNVRFSKQPSQRPPGMSSETYRWKLVDDFVKHFNDHRATTFIPSSHICADESISRWYGLGGEWINIGLPMYIAIDRKPENGCEIQDSACGKSGVMLRIRLVKTAVEEEANSIHVEEDGTLHGTKVLIELVSPWAFSDRLICADSYFASVGAAETLKGMGLRFIGVVKTATRHFPLAYLSNLELENRGDRAGLVHYGPDGNPSLLAFMWMDRNRRYFIASGSSLEEGEEYIRNRWRQVDTAPNADAERVELTVAQPKAAEEYYSTCGSVDQHNRHRMDTLNLEKKIESKEWSRRVNMSIFGMCVVDTWLAWSQATASHSNQRDFYIALAEEMIDNTYDHVGVTAAGRRAPAPTDQPGGSPSLFHRATGAPRGGVFAHLTPTKKKRKRKDGTVTNQAKQGYCSICQKKTKYNCSECIDNQEHGGNDTEHETWLCNAATGRSCFAQHMTSKHDV
jgi:hypothetical protein